MIDVWDVFLGLIWSTRNNQSETKHDVMKNKLYHSLMWGSRHKLDNLCGRMFLENVVVNTETSTFFLKQCKDKKRALFVEVTWRSLECMLCSVCYTMSEDVPGRWWWGGMEGEGVYLILYLKRNCRELLVFSRKEVREWKTKVPYQNHRSILKPAWTFK